MSEVSHKEACPKCRESGKDGSGDNLVVYADGGKHCFSCSYNVPSSSKAPVAEKSTGPFRKYRGEFAPLTDRRISEETCRKFGVQVGSDGSHLYSYFAADGSVQAQHIRKIPKDFFWHYDKGSVKISDLRLFGQNLWSKGGKRLIITEGEVDALTVSQLQENKWPVVSIPSGADAAATAIRANLEWVSSFESVVFAFDMDDAGRKAASECAALLPVGKAYVAKFPLKDANAMLLGGLGADVVNLLWRAEAYRPDGIVAAKDVDLFAAEPTATVWEFPWESMTKTFYGKRAGELIVVTAGSGIGKSTVIREMVHHSMQRGPVGVIMLEEGPKDTIYDMISLELNKPVRRILAARKVNEARKAEGKEPIDFGVIDDLMDEELREAHTKVVGGNRLFLYDHFGSLDSDILIQKMRYLVAGLGCREIYLDHISIVVSGMDSGNERKDIDMMMTNLRQFVESTNCNVVAVSHLRKSDGRAYEEGGRVTLSDLRGSGSIGQLSDLVIGLERNQQSAGGVGANCIVCRGLKDRFGGTTGPFAALEYDKGTGRLREVAFTLDDDGNPTFGTKPAGDDQAFLKDAEGAF